MNLKYFVDFHNIINEHTKDACVMKSASVFMKLVDCYKKRHYHNLKHVTYCLEKLETYTYLAEDLDTIKFALWFHDARDSEFESARFAMKICKYLKTTKRFQDKVRKLILATRHKLAPKTNDEKLICDIDLLILAESQNVFDTYERNVRKEYKHVPIKEFRAKRKEILENFLDRKYIFYIKEIRKQFEDIARENLKYSIKKFS